MDSVSPTVHVASVIGRSVGVVAILFFAGTMSAVLWSPLLALLACGVIAFLVVIFSRDGHSLGSFALVSRGSRIYNGSQSRNSMPL